MVTGRQVWLIDLVTRWDLVVRDLVAIYHVDLHDPAVLHRSWPGVRSLIFGLLSEPKSRLAAALRR